jgi:GDP-4-dehydro-6-deoxy-D-mannose reductase
MRILITGASGFAGGWLTADLRTAGHEPLAVDEQLDVRRAADVRDAIAAAQPDAIAHLAAISFAPDATADPQQAYEVAVLGTLNVLEAMRTLPRPPALLVSGSSEVYGTPAAADLPLTESSPLRPATAYALSKLGQESVALAYAARFGWRVVVTRSFNHTGPGQRAEFVVPALWQRVAAVAAGEATEIPVGNLDVRRDISDVRDVVRSYRLLIEALGSGRLAAGGLTVNVCSGESVAIRWIVDELARLAGITPSLVVDARLVRASDPSEIRGDPSLLEGLTGWQREWTISRTLASIAQAGTAT